MAADAAQSPTLFDPTAYRRFRFVARDLDARGRVTLRYALDDAAYLGGTANAGVVFKVDTSGTETVLYSFTGGADGDYPEAGVIRDSAGNLYGTTIGGGAAGYGV